MNRRIDDTIAFPAGLLLLVVGTLNAHASTLLSNDTFDDWTIGDTASVRCPGLTASGFNLSTDIISSFAQPAVLTASLLNGANLDGARLDGADLRFVFFNGASIDGASFLGANLTRARGLDSTVFSANPPSYDPDTNFDRTGFDPVAAGWKLVGVPDSDGDGIPDDIDICPNSIMGETVVIEDCDSGVENIIFPDGCTLADLVQLCADEAKNHGAFVSCVSQLANGFKNGGVLTGKEKGKLVRCAARSGAGK